MRRVVLLASLFFVMLTTSLPVVGIQSASGVAARTNTHQIAMRPFGPCPGGVPSC